MPLWPGGESPLYPGAKVFGGQILAAAGTNGAPSISFSAQLTMGLYRAGSNQIGVTAAGGTDFYFENAAVSLDRNAVLNWSDGSGLTGSGRDLRLARVGAGQLNIGLGNAGNAQQTGIWMLTELTTIAAAATTDTAMLQPANAIILGVSVRVTTVIPTAATFTVGDAGSAARFSTVAISTAATTTDPGTKAGAYYNASATAVRITPNLTPGAATGVVRVTIHYLALTPPTS